MSFRHRIIYTIAYSLLCFLIVGAIIRGFNKVRLSQEQDMIFEVQNSVEQQAVALGTEILQEQNHLLEAREVVKNMYTDAGNVDAYIEMLKPIAAIDGFVRLSIADKNGIAHTTDGYEIDIAFRDFFKEAIKGKNYISGLITDSILEVDGDIIVFSTPLKVDDEIVGVIFETISAEQLFRQLDVDALGEMGGSSIVDGNGDIVLSTSHSPLAGYDNVFNFVTVETNGTVNAGTAADSEKNISGYRKINNEYVFFAPIVIDNGGEDWYIVSVVSADMLEKRLGEIMYDVPRMMAVCAIFLLILFILLMFDLGRRRIENNKILNAYAYVDPLTNGDNYNSFKHKSEKIKTDGYIVSMDIHAFKAVNSVRGMETGDKVIIKTWEIINDFLKEQEIAAHINADHFVMLLLEKDESAVVDRINAITQKLADIAAELDTPQVIPYFGICEWKSDENIVEAENKAITARRLVKVQNDNNYVFFTEEESERIVENKYIEDSFADAIKNEEFKVWYQPKYNPQNNEIIGAEALVRWEKPDGTILPPNKFIPVFEHNGSIKELDEYMYRKVCEHQMKWYNEGVKLVPISVNISRASIHFRDVVDRYNSIMEDNSLKPLYVPIEITESAAIDDGVIKSVVSAMSQAGIPLHMDDFGSGYSSLASLVKLKFDTVKIDKSLIDTIGEEAGERLIAHSIQLAKELGLSVTAEGAETKEQVEFLKNLGCDSIQGYYYSKPIPYAEFDKMLRQ